MPRSAPARPCWRPGERRSTTPGTPCFRRTEPPALRSAGPVARLDQGNQASFEPIRGLGIDPAGDRGDNDVTRDFLAQFHEDLLPRRSIQSMMKPEPQRVGFAALHRGCDVGIVAQQITRQQPRAALAVADFVRGEAAFG